ncbi:MAG: hypothetical protein QNJ97_20175 [Myxococcota bacterium]|nr:hypothetical protein [Myxococcota bacterium]
MDQKTFEKIESYQGLIEELKIQLLELQVARDGAKQVQEQLNQGLGATSRTKRRFRYRKHLDHLLEGIGVLERGINAAAHNVEVYEEKFDAYLKEVHS